MSERQSLVRVECFQCMVCGHVGINDASETNDACVWCDWSGPAQSEDRCPECHEEGSMVSACPTCGSRYIPLASRYIDNPTARLLTTDELDECFRQKGPVATYEHVQRKLCEVNGIRLVGETTEGQG